MRTLTITEMNSVSGGFIGPGFIDELFTLAAVVFGVGVTCSFALGIASVYTYQYFNK